jgi:predicted nucleic acid-binding protein
MTFLFDASSMIQMFRSFEEEETLRMLDKNAILDLSKYEVGNALWKQHVLRHAISKTEFEEFLSLLQRVITHTRILTITAEDLPKIAKIAAEERITFYDASYITVARNNDLTLTTEDEALTRVASRRIKTATVKEIKP